MDEIDVKIIEILAENASISTTELAEKISLSIPATNKRVRKLQKDGIITRFTVVLDREKINKKILAYVLVILQSESGVRQLLDYVEKEPNILECHAVTGEYDYLLKVCAVDVNGLEDMLLCLKRNKGVIKTHSLLSLQECKCMPTALPDH